MSDVPLGYYLGPKGERLLEFRRQPRLDFTAPFRAEPPQQRPRSRQRARLRHAIYLRDGFLCHYCPKMLREPEGPRRRPNTATIEHIVPRCMGGTNALDNLVLACNDCNHDLGDTLNKCECDFCHAAVKMHKATHLPACNCIFCINYKKRRV